jgi:hypothetical protein
MFIEQAIDVNGKTVLPRQQWTDRKVDKQTNVDRKI